ncbi:ABC transporter transmembrane domain-containing protein [Ruegeria sp. Ofav3-42]|uniref:ABC transporter transmembrane domain-containing protein n=1 Tax=Ruegeria sp. Ofav3-42 TaxID=2917759 RepID=UPI001EF56472|nr:ABC transporter transmembrane domain-containing protein [Ruegeria sp. Ofav3-42]MCG7522171.1 ATP-binding cassette domain-containing protein [Ruegeria sp. Ofav3-42]
MNAQTVGRLLYQLLLAGGWRNNQDRLLEAFPHMSEKLRPADLFETLDNLKLPYTQIRCRERDITAQECPALIVPENGACYLALNRDGGDLQISDDQNPDLRHLKPGRHWCTVIRIDPSTQQQVAKRFTSVRSAFGELGPMMPWLVAASLLSNILGLMVPLLIMGIYERVIPSGSVDLLISLTIGVVIIGVSDLCFRHARTRALAYAGWRAERQLMIALFRKLMSLPISQIQKSDVDQQLSRFRQFESLRDVFTGQVMTTLLDLPFVLIFFSVLVYLAPQVGLLTLGLATFLIAVGLITIPRQKRLDQEAAEAAAASQSAMLDTIRHQRAIANLGMQNQWLKRCMPMAENAESSTRRARQFQALSQSLAQSVSALATMGAIILCAHGALIGEVSFGGLIASIALVSKILAPIQSLYTNFPQILSFRSSRNQADRVLGLNEEMEVGLEQTHQKTLSGAIAFSSVTFRPDPLNAPVLSQASFNCEPGEVVLVMGSDAAGRTAVLDLIDGSYTPLAGTIEHDGVDIRQIAKDERRKSITYATYDLSLFYGTIAQNFRLASPSVSDAEIKAALSAMDLLDDQDLLPDGIGTRLTDRDLARLPAETLKSVVLARCMARQSSIYLFSEPTNSLSDHRRHSFRDWVQSQQGRRTVVIATADQSFVQLADRFIFLNGDRVVVNGTGDAGRRKLQAVLKTLGRG